MQSSVINIGESGGGVAKAIIGDENQ